MSRRFLIMASLATVLAVAGYWGHRRSRVGAHAGWKTDLASALAEAKSSGKPVLVDFGADW